MPCEMKKSMMESVVSMGYMYGILLSFHDLLTSFPMAWTRRPLRHNNSFSWHNSMVDQ